MKFKEVLLREDMFCVYWNHGFLSILPIPYLYFSVSAIWGAGLQYWPVLSIGGTLATRFSSLSCAMEYIDPRVWRTLATGAGHL
jgi:hypothetical protein